MPTDKEIEVAVEQVEALDFDNEWGIEHITYEAAHTLRDAYLSMKAERNKYQEIVEADTEAIREARDYIGELPEDEYNARWVGERGPYDKLSCALALRENKEE